MHIRVFSRDILKWGNIGVRAGDRGVLGVYYILENIIREVIVSSNFEETKGYSPGFFFGVRKNMLRKVIHLKVNEKRN